MPALASPEFLPGTVVHYSGEIRHPRSQGRVEMLEWLGGLMMVHHTLPAPEETVMIFRGMGLDVQQTADVLAKDVETIRTHSTHAFAALDAESSIIIATNHLFAPQYGPILTIDKPVELPAEPDEGLLRLLDFLSTGKSYAKASSYPGLSPDKVKRGLQKYIAQAGVRNREELMFWANAARIRGPGEMVIKPSPPPNPQEFPLWNPARGMPHTDFSIITHAALALEESRHFPRTAMLPPDARLKFEGGRLVKIVGWGGSVAVNRECEFYKTIDEAGINHLGTVILGLTVEQSKVTSPNSDLARRRFRRQFELETLQPVYYAVQRAFDEGLVKVDQEVNPYFFPDKDTIWDILPDLMNSRNQKAASGKLGMSERALTYAVQRACEQLGVSEFGAVIAYSHLVGRQATTSKTS